MEKTLNPEIWGPHYWFMIHTIAINYPKHPSSSIKRKYYDFIQNLPLFIPSSKVSVEFSNLIEQYPITPYLDSNNSFVGWIHFIHNKINEKLNKSKISLDDFYTKYYESYNLPQKNDILQNTLYKKYIVYFITISVLVGLFIKCNN